ncbi:MAG TPA: glycosyltransferase family 1 protein [Puia sp.]|nr:glycosyltransferase family 1 protein [Puia sp.]
MDWKEKKVCFLLRKPGRFFSIERIFQQLAPEIGQYMQVTRWEAPHATFTPAKIWANILSVRKSSAEVYHVTGDIHYIVLGLPRKRTLLTIHDCVFLYSATGLKRRLLKWILLDMPVRRSRLITTISEATKSDILKYTGCSPEKLVVIPDPVSDTIRYSETQFRREEPVLLFVGTTPNKNLLRVAKALHGISCRLDIVGRLSEEQQAALKENQIRYTQQAGLTDEEMAAKYTAADIVLFPSTFEGFGLPIVEGQKTGRPVITSDLSPMRDTAGPGACLVDPYDPASIREGILRVIGDEDYRGNLIKEGLQNVSRFSAETIAGAYIECYKKLLNT